MKKTLFTFLLFVSGLACCLAQSNSNDLPIQIIPEPVSFQPGKKYFRLKPSTAIVYTDKQITGIAGILADMLHAPTGYHLTVKNRGGVRSRNAIILKLNTTRDTVLKEGGYKLEATTARVLVSANEPRGLFYGIQTLMQLFPPEIALKAPAAASGSNTMLWQIPCVEVLDYPRFSWRGLELDVSRHFFSKEFVKKYINQMAKYKYNVLHLHLTDDQGWRIEIKALPDLTRIGAWRVPRTGKWMKFAPPQPGEKATYGGYYTQEDIREIVAYAEKRFVTILPEIDVPGHSLALIATYPNLSNTGLQYSVNPGSPYWPEQDNQLCIGNDSTWLILDKIFTEVAALFPGEYIHVGGDEAFKGFWKDCPKDQALMKREGIKTLEELQAYFEKRMEKMILSKGKKMIGWDEILEGGLAPEAAVMSWRGMQGGIDAAKMGHHVVMTPSQYCYLDLYQGDPLIEPSTYGKVRLSTSYRFEPVPDGVDPQFILGGQGNLWTESIPTERHAEYMTWPRGLALAEVFWSPKNKRNWDDFVTRMQHRFRYMDAAQVNYARSAYDPIITGTRDAKDSLQVKLATEISGLDIYYTFDNTNPDNFSPKYAGMPLDIPKGAFQIRVITYRDGRPVGKQINCPLDVVAERVEE